jgi:hypothetical protein
MIKTSNLLQVERQIEKTPSDKIGGRLIQYVEEWKKIDCSERVLDWVDKSRNHFKCKEPNDKSKSTKEYERNKLDKRKVEKLFRTRYNTSSKKRIR